MEVVFALFLGMSFRSEEQESAVVFCRYRFIQNVRHRESESIFLSSIDYPHEKLIL
jgi:hypothetical protein